MIGQTYPVKSNVGKTAFLFESVGPKGSILKFVLLEDLGEMVNLALGDIVNGQLIDSVTSNNQDIVVILNTVANCVYKFLEMNPGRLIRIDPYDENIPDCDIILGGFPCQDFSMIWKLSCCFSVVNKNSSVCIGRNFRPLKLKIRFWRRQ